MIILTIVPSEFFSDYDGAGGFSEEGRQAVLDASIGHTNDFIGIPSNWDSRLEIDFQRLNHKALSRADFLHITSLLVTQTKQSEMKRVREFVSRKNEE